MNPFLIRQLIWLMIRITSTMFNRKLIDKGAKRPLIHTVTITGLMSTIGFISYDFFEFLKKKHELDQKRIHILKLGENKNLEQDDHH